MTNKPLSGLRVIEIGHIAVGPFVGMLLADLGADVVKIENPNKGDGMRQWPPLLEENDNIYSGNFASLNRNKRSVTINFKDSADVKKLKKLCSKSDILVENNRPGVLEKYNLGYDQIKKINSKIIYCSISGYGQYGPYSKKGAFDVTIQAISGLMSVTGDKSGDSVKCGVPVGDFVTGLYAAYSIMSAVFRRNRDGKGAYIDSSMIGSLLGISALQTSQYFGTGESPEKLGSAHPRNAPYQGFLSSNKPFVIAAGNDRLWEKVCEVVNLPNLLNDNRFKTQLLRAKNQIVLAEKLQEVFSKQPVEFWLKKFDEKGVPCAPVNNYHEALHDEHVKSMDLIGELQLPIGKKEKYVAFPINISEFEFDIYYNPPMLGEHNQEVVNEWL